MERIRKIMMKEEATDGELKALREFIRSEKEDEQERAKSQKTPSWSKEDWDNFFKKGGEEGKGAKLGENWQVVRGPGWFATGRVVSWRSQEQRREETTMTIQPWRK